MQPVSAIDSPYWMALGETIVNRVDNFDVSREATLQDGDSKRKLTVVGWTRMRVFHHAVG